MHHTSIYQRQQHPRPMLNSASHAPAQFAHPLQAPIPRVRWGELKVILCMALAILAGLLSPESRAAESYTVTQIQVLQGGSFYPATNGINDNGDVVGRYYRPTFGWGAAVWRNGVLTELPLLPGTVTAYATGINNAGQIVGACEVSANGSGISRAAIWENGTVRALPALAGWTSSHAAGINDSGNVVGTASSPGAWTPYGQLARADAVLWQGDTVSVLVAPTAGAETEARAINASGEVACTWRTSPFSPFPSRWKPHIPNGTTGTMITVEASGGSVGDINDAGTLAGCDGESQPSIWHGTAKTRLPLLPGFTSGFAGSINVEETVIGSVSVFEETEEGTREWYNVCVWDAAHGVRELNALLAPIGYVQAAIGINNRGQILASAGSAQHMVLTPTNLPPAPAYLLAWGDLSQIALGWTPAPGATSYNVKKGTAPGGPYAIVAQNLTSESYVDTDVMTNTRYYYVVTSVGPNGESLPSSEASAIPGVPAPNWIGVQAADRAATVYWDGSFGASSYNVKRSTVSGGPYAIIAAGQVDSGFVDRTVVNGTRYYYVVTAVAAGYESLPSPEATALPLAPPLPPSGLSASAAKGRVQLGWIQSPSPSIVRNKVYRSTNSSFGYVVIAEIPAGTAYLDRNVSRSRTYYYSITAVNSNEQEGSYSGVVAARTK